MIACLDLEGVLLPEIWIKFAEKTGIDELKLTTRDIPNYSALMQKRIQILQAHDLKINDSVIVIKNPPREDVISAYGESEFLILPSQWELSPLVPLESFAFKKPVISTKSHGIPFTVQDNKNGILVEPDNPVQLADAIKKLLLDEDLRERLGISGYNFVHEECNCESMAKNSVELYKEVLKNNYNK